MSENGLKWSFSKDSYGFYFTFVRENGTNYGTNGTNYGTNELKDLSESEHQIYDLLCSNPRYIREELAKLTNKTKIWLSYVLFRWQGQKDSNPH